MNPIASAIQAFQKLRGQTPTPAPVQQAPVQQGYGSILNNFAKTLSNAWGGYINNVAKPMAVGVPQVQQAMQRVIPQVQQQFRLPAYTPSQIQGQNFVKDLGKGFLGEAKGLFQGQYGGQNFAPRPEVAFKPQNKAQQVGASGFGGLGDITAWQNAGLNTAMEDLTKMGIGALKFNPVTGKIIAKGEQKLADASRVLEDFAKSKGVKPVNANDLSLGLRTKNLTKAEHNALYPQELPQSPTPPEVPPTIGTKGVSPTISQAGLYDANKPFRTIQGTNGPKRTSVTRSQDVIVHPDIKTFATKTPEGWYVIEKSTGLSVSDAQPTMAKAVERAKGIVERVTGNGVSIKQTVTDMLSKMENGGQIKPVRIDPKVEELEGNMKALKGLGMDQTNPEMYSKQFKEWQKLKYPEQLNKVADNLQKNNSGLGRTDAEAMAKDVIANRKFNVALSVPKGVEVTKGNLSSQPVTDLQTNTKLSPTQLESEVPTRTTATQAVSSPEIIQQKGQLNINKLNVSGEGKAVLQAQEKGVVPTVIGNKQVVDMARTAKGTGTLSDATMQKLMAQQLKNRQVVVDLTEQFNNAKSGGASDVELAKIMLNIADQSNTARQGGTFAGRLLQAQNILADQSASPMQKIFALLDNAGADKTKYIQDAVKVNWDNPTQVVDFYRKYVPPKFGEVLDEVRYSNMLSSPLTHIVNTASNALQTGVIAPVEKTITGALDWGKSALTGSERQYYMRSGVDYAGGYVKALPEAFAKFKKVMSGEEVLVKPDYERIPTGTKGLLSAYTTPLKMLEAADQFFKTLVESGVTNELKNGPRKMTPIQISGAATKEANYRLFRQAFDPNGELGSGIVLKTFDKWNSAIANLRRLPGGKWVLPFLQTPTNILKQGVEFSPLGFTTAIGAKAPIEQISKALIGTSVFMGAYGLAKSGMTTWDAPPSGSERDLFYSAGMQPYSVKIGNNWVSYSKLGPLSYPIAMAAALANAEKNNPDKSFVDNIGKGISGILGFFGDQSYVRSIGDLVDAIRGGGNVGSSAFTSEAANLTGQLVPYHSFLTWLGRLIDPTYRKATTFGEKLKKDLPVLGGGLQPYTDLQGNPSKRDYPVLNAVSPYQVTQEKSPEAQMLQEMQTKKIQGAVQKRADEAFQAGDTSQQVTGNIIRYIDENGTLRKIDLTPPKQPVLTGNTELDKKLKSNYSSALTTQANNIVKLWELGKIDQNQAEQMLQQIKLLKEKSAAPKKGKKVATLKYKKIKLAKSKPSKIKLAKLKPLKLKYGVAKLAKFKSKGLKLSKVKQPKVKPLSLSNYT